MIPKKHLFALAIAATLAACGGGSDNSASAGAGTGTGTGTGGTGTGTGGTGTGTGSGTGGAGSAANNGCYDIALADTQGTRMVVAYTYSGTITGTQTGDTLVGGITTFEGRQARETTVTTTGSNTLSGTTVAVNTNIKSYSTRAGDTVTQYGAIVAASGSAAGINFTTTTKIVYNPPYVDTFYTLAAGQSVTVAQTGTASTTNSLVAGTTNTAVNTSTTTKYVGQESVTVPAGTYNTCKFEVTTAGSSEVTTSWVIVGKGIPVQITSTGQAIKATSVQLNGATL